MRSCSPTSCNSSLQKFNDPFENNKKNPAKKVNYLQKDVTWLQITMNNTLEMQPLHRRGHNRAIKHYLG